MPIAKKILIIEDDKPMARALTVKLIRAGFEVESTGNGKDGLEILEKRVFSLILLDLVLPELDGFKVLEKLKEKGNKTPIIIVSNLSQPEDEKKARAFGVAEFLVKSDTPIAKIVERVKEKLNVVRD